MTDENVTTKDSPLTAEVLGELARAEMKFPAFNSAHEGYAVLLEEVEELKREVFWGQTEAGINGKHEGATRVDRMRAEAIQIAAMAIRFVKDVTERHACMFGCGETFDTQREAILHAAGKHANNA